MANEMQMTDYERRRLENIKRNSDMISSLHITSILSRLSSSSFKSPRKLQKKDYERSRSSLRKQGVPPSHPSGLFYPPKPSSWVPVSVLRRQGNFRNGRISMTNVYKGGDDSHESFVAKLAAVTNNSVNNVGRIAVDESVNVYAFNLVSEDVAQIVPDWPSTIQFFPTADVTMVVAGSRSGHLGFADFSSHDGNEGGKIVHLYQPHCSTIYAVSIHPFSPTKMYSCCYEGHLRLMNTETEKFDLVYSSSPGSSLYSLSQQPNDANSIFIGEGPGGLNMFDGRAGMIVNSWLLHEGRINAIDINPANTNVIATSSSNGFACLWDLRKMNDRHSECKAFKEFGHGRSTHSAYFSPSGNCLAITSLGNNVDVLSGANYEDIQIVHRGHLNKSETKCSRAIWGWDDTYLYTSNKKRQVEVLSVPQGKTVSTLESSLISAVPFQFAAHPCTVGMLAGTTFSGKVFVWRSHDC